MYVRRFYEERLAQASYLVGCQATGESLVIDPNRDVEQYIDAAEVEGLRVTHVTETHIHADFVSGSRELAGRTGATLYLSGEGGEDWRYAYAAADGAVLLTDGDEFEVGRIRIRALHTPGHTPEHLTYLITDAASTDRPIAAATGDFIFVGDVGRPDLLERAAQVEGTMEGAARTLYRSVADFRSQYPEFLQIWPGHGAGSACGKGLGAIPTSTLGYELVTNWGLAFEDEDAFVESVLAGQPEPPAYFATMKRVNRDGPPVLGGFRRPPRLGGDRLDALVADQELVVDLRPAAEFAGRLVPGTINLPIDWRAFTTWAGWFVPFDRDVHLIGDPHEVDAAVRALAMIGLDRVVSCFERSVLGARAVGRIEAIAPAELAERGDEVQIVDVRGAAEWAGGHIPGATHLPGGYLLERIQELDRSRPIAFVCQSGARSAVVASVARAHGVRPVLDLAGGLSAWERAGLPISSVRGSS